MNKSPSRRQRSIIYPNASAIIPPDITFVGNYERSENINNEDLYKKQRKLKFEQITNSDPNIFLENFSKLNYVERYINANFRHAKCFMNELKKRYELPGIEKKKPIIEKFKLFFCIFS